MAAVAYNDFLYLSQVCLQLAELYGPALGAYSPKSYSPSSTSASVSAHKHTRSAFQYMTSHVSHLRQTGEKFLLVHVQRQQSHLIKVLLPSVNVCPNHSYVANMAEICAATGAGAGDDTDAGAYDDGVSGSSSGSGSGSGQRIGQGLVVDKAVLVAKQLAHGLGLNDDTPIVKNSEESMFDLIQALQSYAHMWCSILAHNVWARVIGSLLETTVVNFLYPVLHTDTIDMSCGSAISALVRVFQVREVRLKLACVKLFGSFLYTSYPAVSRCGHALSMSCLSFPSPICPLFVLTASL